jgi:hypothetical protein
MLTTRVDESLSRHRLRQRRINHIGGVMPPADRRG